MDKTDQIKALVSTIGDRDEWIVKLDDKNLELNNQNKELSDQCDKIGRASCRERV